MSSLPIVLIIVIVCYFLQGRCICREICVYRPRERYRWYIYCSRVDVYVETYVYIDLENGTDSIFIVPG